MKRPEQRGRTRPYHGAMIYVTKYVRPGIVIAVIGVLGWLGGCSDAPTSAPPPPPPAPPLAPPPTIAIVSDPTPAAGFASGTAESSVQLGSAGNEVAYVSLTPGTVPTGATATIRRVGGAASLVTTVSDGGFDPVPVQAQTNDSIDVVVRDAGGVNVAVLRLVVAVRRPPVVVRTNPPRKKNDVPLNAAIMVVFSEPVDGGTLTPASVQLLRGTTPVAGTVRLLDASGLVALFEPAQLLAPATAYHLSVGQAVRDRDGDALESPVAIDFTTGSALTGEAASLTVYPEQVEEFFPVTMTVTAYVRDASGNVLLAPTVQWASSDTSVAVVRPGLAWWQTSGREAWLTLRAGGVATITATSGSLSDTLVVRSRPIPGERLGNLGVTTATTGMDFDPNGFSFIVAGAGYQRTLWISENGSEGLAIPVGDYAVTLVNLGSHCAVGGANPQTVTITEGNTSKVAFAVSCSSAVNGSVRLRTVTTGEDLDPNGYWVQLPWDPWGVAAAAPANGSLLFPAVAAGQQGFSLFDVASNCAVVGGEHQTVTVTAGDTSDVTFTVTCAGNLPSLRVTIATTGIDVDPDGYQLFIDGINTWCGQPSWNCGPVPANGSVTASLTAESQYLVVLSGIAENCAVIGPNPQVVKIVRGTTVDLSFAVTCGSGAPSVRVTTATTGGDLDVDGYRVNVLGFGFQDGASVNGSVAFYFMPPGAYSVELQDIAPNCAVSGSGRRAVTVTNSSTAELAFDVTCSSAANGSIRVTTVTTGADVDPDGYTGGLVGYAYGFSVPVNGFYTYPSVQPGAYSVELKGVASNCTVSGANPQAVTVTIGATADAVFAVSCRAVGGP